jgi:hypothetical protein
MILGHPHPLHGGTMHTKVVYRAAKTLLELGCAVLRFNFRGVGRSPGQFDEGLGEQDDFRAAVTYVASTYPDLQVWAAGASFGAYIAMSVGATDERIAALIGVAPPVNRYDFSDIEASPKPKFIIHGEEDELTSRSVAVVSSATGPKLLAR